MKNSKSAEITKKQKYLLSLQKELRSIQQEIRSLPLVPYPKPIFYSYAIKWTIRDLRLKRYSEVYEYILEKHGEFTRTKSIKKARELNPPKIMISNKDYIKLLDKYPMASRWFIKAKDKYNNKVHIFNKQDLLVKGIFKLFVTHSRSISPKLEKRKAEIKDIIYGNYKNAGLLNKYLGISRTWRDDLRYKFEAKYLDNIAKEGL
ncbi:MULTISPECIES: hypothetical protein [Leptospira]|uniref:DUF1564 family protein n=1 Tax=Leptospira licerasiae str. MMD4847 TaxID=1049971 RepID=A0ABP2RE91_9LEPT|nr:MULTISPECIES: hypothetical protein [Leptospira]EIE01314.1 hypothetical protein LEP1GSC185_3431 [Leptospira licerasiae serovar Varillal str. VAR 010]EJZ42814.1 hypothetical protein LEP1GSC178_3044 [Leptospira licerasiae str. MMD4847]EMK01220.1 hypothetical protein LEP1GSC192_1195 [Leptospira sp. B5-022]MCR1795686.1 hypothetical protein [Leptospira sp. id769339]